MNSAFQSNAFQANAYQISSQVISSIGGGGYALPYDRHAAEESAHRKLESERQKLQQIELRIAEAEERKLSAIAQQRQSIRAKNAAHKRAALEASLQEEIGQLRIERAELMQRIMNEEEAFFLLFLA